MPKGVAFETTNSNGDTLVVCPDCKGRGCDKCGKSGFRVFKKVRYDGENSK